MVSSKDANLQSDPYLKLEKEKRIFFILFFFLGNYFAIFSIWLIDKAKKSLHKNEVQKFDKQMRFARFYAYWGMIPATVINMAILYIAYILLRELYLYLSSVLAI